MNRKILLLFSLIISFALFGTLYANDFRGNFDITDAGYSYSGGYYPYGNYYAYGAYYPSAYPYTYNYVNQYDYQYTNAYYPSYYGAHINPYTGMTTYSGYPRTHYTYPVYSYYPNSLGLVVDNTALTFSWQ